jgi:8-oxo-dGTP pyrophosphatase MutT (NUDIX family)
MTRRSSIWCASRVRPWTKRRCWSCAQRELDEEIAKRAEDWSELKRFYTSPGFAQEEVTLFLATGLSDTDSESDPEERLEVVPWRLDDLDGAIDACHDSKSLIGLLLLRDTLRS